MLCYATLRRVRLPLAYAIVSSTLLCASAVEGRLFMSYTKASSGTRDIVHVIIHCSRAYSLRCGSSIAPSLNPTSFQAGYHPHLLHPRIRLSALAHHAPQPRVLIAGQTQLWVSDRD